MELEKSLLLLTRRYDPPGFNDSAVAATARARTTLPVTLTPAKLWPPQRPGRGATVCHGTVTVRQVSVPSQWYHATMPESLAGPSYDSDRPAEVAVL